MSILHKGQRGEVGCGIMIVKILWEAQVVLILTNGQWLGHNKFKKKSTNPFHSK